MPTAIICSNDFSAVGAMREILVNGYKVPQDVSFIGIDNTNLLCSLTNPKLTSIDIGRYNTGEIAFELLFNRIQDKGRPSQRKIIKSTLIKRDSVIKAKA